MIPLGSEIVVSVNDRQWRLVSNLRDAGPADTVFILDSQSGSVRFGNGVQGAKPPVGSTITVSYRQGTGSSGNISKEIHDATDVRKFWVIVRDHAQILGWGNRRNIRRVRRRQ
jgi:hypothetical protein